MEAIMPANNSSAPGRRPSVQDVQNARALLGNPATLMPANRAQWQHLVQTSWAVLHSDRAARRNRPVLQLITTHEGGAA
jgi:hypothetical protein